MNWRAIDEMSNGEVVFAVALAFVGGLLVGTMVYPLVRFVS